MHIDFSAHSAWDQCAAYWFERYVNKRQRKWPKAQRDDALCLGSLVHEGLRVWQESHVIQIPGEVIEENTPTSECLRLAEELVWGYSQAYPEEHWPLIRCEEPVVFPLEAEGYWCGNCNSIGMPFKDGACQQCEAQMIPRIQRLDGLAKIDSYFYNPEVAYLESGIPGLILTLQPGWWIHEYKTKSPYIPMGIYMQGWEMGMQASYQTMALQEKLLTEMEYRDFQMHHGVQGILINVLEKPRRHIPQRTCKSCKEKYEFASWIPTGDGRYSCPVCGEKQLLTALKDNQPHIPPAYYRFVVTRTPQELARDRTDMITVGQRMMAMEAGGLYSEPWKKSSCVNTQWKRACDYFGSHSHFEDTRSDDNYYTPADYRGLIQVEGV